MRELPRGSDAIPPSEFPERQIIADVIYSARRDWQLGEKMLLSGGHLKKALSGKPKQMRTPAWTLHIIANFDSADAFFYGRFAPTFEWMAHHLGLDPDLIRERLGGHDSEARAIRHGWSR